MRLVVMAAVLVAAVHSSSAQGGIDASAVAKANDPLADMNAFNFHNFYGASLHGVPDATSNTLNLRGVAVMGRQIIRATLPVSTVPTDATSSASGLGDFNIFDAIVVTGPSASTTLGVGPLLVAPTASEDALGAKNTWQGGAAAVAVKSLGPGSLVGGLATWQTDFAGGDGRVDTNLATAQVFFSAFIGNGFYLRSTPVWIFDFENDVHVVPLGLGVGKVTKFGGAVANLFLEPQFTVYHEGQGAPSVQVFLGMNFQFAKKG